MIRYGYIMVDFNPKESFLYVHEICIFRQEAAIDKLNPADIRILRREYEAEKNILSGERQPKADIKPLWNQFIPG